MYQIYFNQIELNLKDLFLLNLIKYSKIKRDIMNQNVIESN